MLNKLYQEYGNRVAFFVVYILEAHASDLWQVEANRKQGVLISSSADREATANACVRNLHIQIPALIDNPDNSTEAAYHGWPDRLYLIGADERVVYKSAPGPFGFHPAELESALRRIVK